MALLTLAEIARRLDIPASSVSYYRDKFKQYIPELGEGRHRRYTEESYEVLRFIADCMRSGLPADAVEAALQEKYGVIAEIQQEDMPATQQQESALMFREMLWDAMHDLIEQQTNAIREQLTMEFQQTIEKSKRENERLLEELNKRNSSIEQRIEERDKALLETLRAIQESAAAAAKAAKEAKDVAQEEKQKGFFKRLFG